ncbi:hydroxypyruvate isomerase family protein [Pseudomonas sp.]|uniref:hydroxypyruvate isomerase family protein n=1 Tax=Pseudomonas sp. TaxID=306 RepID=UPI00272AD71F|nr:TIM barrel protein [Pseudomonas sp.]
MPWPLAANLSLLFTEVDLLSRISLAAKAGFDGVEVQFPYEVPAESLKQALLQASMPLALINVPAGDLMTGGPGLAGVRSRQADFERALDQAIAYARIARPQRINVLPGRLAPDSTREKALDTLISNCRLAAERLADEGIAVTCEAVNRHDMPGFLIATAAELSEVLDRVDHPNFSAQLDIYHMARMGEGTEGVEEAIATLTGRIGHVQFADAPGRGEPGTGELDFARCISVLAASGYHGWLSAEYRPSATTEAALGWVEHWRQAGWITPPARSESPGR